MSAIFDINFIKLTELLLPTFLRHDVLRSFLNAIVAPVITLHNQFIVRRKNNIYRATMNGQVCHLRRVLNDAFPEANNAIRIEDGSTTGHWQYAWDSEYNPYLNYLLIKHEGTIFWDKSTILEGVSGFTVVVPSGIYDENNDAILRSLLNEYKLVSKFYTIIYE